MTLENQFEQENIKNIIQYNRKIEKILNQAAKDLAKKISVFELKYPTTTISKNSFYLRNKGLKGKIDTILNKLHKDIGANIKAGIVTNWDLANFIPLAHLSVNSSFFKLDKFQLETIPALILAPISLWSLFNITSTLPANPLLRR